MPHRVLSASLGLLLLLVTPLLVTASAQDRSLDPISAFRANVARGATAAPRTLVLKVAPGTHRAAVVRAAEERGCAVRRQLPRRPIWVLGCGDQAPDEALMRAWYSTPIARWWEPAWLDGEEQSGRAGPPNDLDGDGWQHLNEGQTVDGRIGVPGADLGSLEAWETTTGRDTILIAVADTGVDIAHPELAASIWRNDGEVCGNGVDDDDNGWTDDCSGWDTADDDADASPDALPEDKPSGSICRRSHGTFIAGIIGAAGGNGEGSLGLAWNARLLPIKRVTDEDCLGTSLTTLEGVYFALTQRARVLNLSYSSTAYSELLAEGLIEAESRGLLVTMSAGNDGADVDDREGNPRYPNHYPLEHALTVAHTTNRDALAGAANFGAIEVDLAAPGVDITSTVRTAYGDYEQRSGSSYAAPMAAGVAALVWSAFPELQLATVSRAIREGASPLPALSCAVATRCVATGARLSAAGALERAWELAVAPELVEVTTSDAAGGDGDGVIEGGEQIELRVTVRASGTRAAVTPLATLAPHAWEISTGPANSDIPMLPMAGVPATWANERPWLLQLPTCQTPGVEALELRLRDAGGPGQPTWALPFELAYTCPPVETPGAEPDGNRAAEADEADAASGPEIDLASDDGAATNARTSSGCAADGGARAVEGVPFFLLVGSIALCLLDRRRLRPFDRRQERGARTTVGGDPTRTQ